MQAWVPSPPPVSCSWLCSSKPCCRYELKNMPQDSLKLAFEICQIDTYQFTSIKLRFDVSYVCLETAGTCWRM